MAQNDTIIDYLWKNESEMLFLYWEPNNDMTSFSMRYCYRDLKR